MKLKELAVGYIEIPLVTPFKTALRTVNSVNDLIVKVTAEDGTEGYGEAPPTAVITGDTKESIEAAIRYYIAPAILGMDLEDLPGIMTKMEKSLAKNTSAKAAVDIALYDLYAKLQNKPLFRLLGEQDAKPVKTELETDLTISVNETEEMVKDSLEAVKQGFRILKVKVGKGGEKDVERMQIRDGQGKRQFPPSQPWKMQALALSWWNSRFPITILRECSMLLPMCRHRCWQMKAFFPMKMPCVLWKSMEQI